MTDELWKEFEDARSQRLGVYILRQRDSAGALAIANLVSDDPEGTTLCVFKSIPDAEEYRYNWLVDADEWEVYGSDSIADSIEMIREGTYPRDFITLNPPLKAEGDYCIIEVEKFLGCMEDSLEYNYEQWDAPEENQDEHVEW